MDIVMAIIYGVLLTDLGWQDLDSPLRPYTSEGPDGKYIYCTSVHPDGPFFVMVASCENSDGSTFEAEISIPHHYVKFIVSTAEKSQIGFMQ
jgi:hypothetical protein